MLSFAGPIQYKLELIRLYIDSPTLPLSNCPAAIQTTNENNIIQRQLSAVLLVQLTRKYGMEQLPTLQSLLVKVSSKDGALIPLTIIVAHWSDVATATNGLGDEFVHG